MRKAAILQSNYIPWKGYFDLINEVDVFVILDTVQYTKNDWRNRNKIKTQHGLKWLTVPVLTDNRFGQTIKEAKIKTEAPWQRKHWAALEMSYSKAPYFSMYREPLEAIYKQQVWTHISDLNIHFIKTICGFLEITTELVFAEDLAVDLSDVEDRRNARVIEICKQVEADYYLSGPAAKSYIDESQFEEAGIELKFKDYSGYPEYLQLHGEFEHGVSVLDMLFMVGEDALVSLTLQNKKTGQLLGCPRSFGLENPS